MGQAQCASGSCGSLSLGGLSQSVFLSAFSIAFAPLRETKVEPIEFLAKAQRKS